MSINIYNYNKIDLPKNKIDVFGYCISYPIKLTMKYLPSAKKGSNKLEVYTLNNKIYCSSYDGEVIVDAQNNPIIGVKDKFLGSSYIYLGNAKDNKIVKFDSKYSTQAEKYNITFFNKATQQEEILDINSDWFFCSTGIFQGREKDNSPMIAKIVEIMDANAFSVTFKEYTFSLEIAPGVDIMLIIGVALYIAQELHLIRDKRFEKNVIV